MTENHDPLPGEKFSIVIPCYNRAWCIERAVLSAVDFLENQDGSEVIVVDDGSSDETPELAQALFKKLEDEGTGIRFSLIRHVMNLGVCAAKNTGARSASGEWLVFLDSDDELIVGSFSAMQKSLELNDDVPLHFFRCTSESSQAISNSLSTERRSFSSYLRLGTDGEALPVIRRKVFSRFPYDEDISGYESLSYMRIAKAYEHVCIHALVARRYHVNHADRLSVAGNVKKRSGSLAKGHLRVLSEHSADMSLLILIKYILKFLRMKFVSFV